MTAHELEQRITLTNTIVKGAELLTKELEQAKNAYKFIVNACDMEGIKACGLFLVHAAIMKHTPLSLMALRETTSVLNHLNTVVKIAKGLPHVFELSELKASSIADIGLILVGLLSTVEVLAQANAKIQAVEVEQAVIIDNLKVEQAEQLATIKDAILVEDAEKKELDRLADLATNCDSAGLSEAYEQYTGMVVGAAKTAYNAQLCRMLALYDQEDMHKADKVYTVYDSLTQWDMVTLQSAYAKAIEELSTSSKDRLLTGFDTIFNKDTQQCASKLRQALHSVMGSVIDGKETTERNTLICLVQQLVRELEMQDKKAA
jgi:hypothetical protein